MESTDINTAEELSKGNVKAFNRVVDRYYKNIWLYFKKKTSRHEIADELANDTFDRLWKYRGKIDTDLAAYLRQIAYNIFQDWQKDTEKERKQMADYLSDYRQSDEQTGGQDALNAQMDTAIIVDKLALVLPKKRCQVFLMSRMHGMSYEEIANALSISKATVKDHLVKAKKTISEMGGFWKYP